MWAFKGADSLLCLLTLLAPQLAGIVYRQRDRIVKPQAVGSGVRPLALDPLTGRRCALLLSSRTASVSRAIRNHISRRMAFAPDVGVHGSRLSRFPRSAGMTVAARSSRQC